jgi:Peptidase family C25
MTIRKSVFSALLASTIALTSALGSVQIGAARGTVSAAPAAANAGEGAPSIEVTAGPGSVRVRANTAPNSMSAAGDGVSDTELGSVRVPGRIFAVMVQDSTAFDQAIAALKAAPLQSEAWTGEVARLPARQREAVEGADAEILRQAVSTMVDTPADLPAAPLTILRDARYRDQRIVTLAVSLLYRPAGDNQNRAVRDFAVELPGATYLADPGALTAEAGSDALSAAGATTVQGASAIPAPAPYWLAQGAAKRLTVTREGLQRISASALGAAGLTAANACVHYRGTTLALHEPGDGSVIFYAQAPGDRYNAGEIYWVTANGCARMAAPANSPAASGSDAAYERGAWREYAVYYDQQGGIDGDHWFSKDLRFVSGQPLQSWNLTLPLSPLPAAPGNAVYTVRGATRTVANYTLAASGNGVSASQTWAGDGKFEITLASNNNMLPAALSLTQGTWLYIDDFAWIRPARLNFATGAAAFFVTTSGTYHLRNAGSAQLYDVTNPLAPMLVNTTPASGADRRFASTANRNYILAGPRMMATHNTLNNYTPRASVAAALNKRAYYIAPASLVNDPNSGLAQLVAYRNTQGWNAIAVPVEALYDHWSHGNVSPEAIREFLQWQWNASTTKPAAAILIGDGNYDWRGFLDRGRYYAFTNYLPFVRGAGAGAGTVRAPFTRLIPPYMADVDRYRASTSISNAPAAETACEACFAQLDGHNPLDDLVSDLIFGRMPVNGSAQLKSVVDKILRYEQLDAASTNAGSWRSRVTYLSDNHVRAPEGQNIVNGVLPPGPINDTAGPFWTFADGTINNAQAIGPTYVRRYYDPYNAYPTASARLPAPVGSNNIPGDAAKAEFNAGAAFMIYIGHSNQQRIGQMENADPYADGFLYDYEIPNLANTDRLPVMVQMTCLTASFHQHDPNGSNPGKEVYMDERLFLQEGNRGAIAVWGSTGLGVMYGHQPLLSGYFKTYWSGYAANPGSPPTVGAAANGGYLRLFTENGGSGEDSLRTYLVIGDPLTRARAYVPGGVTPRP